MARAWLHAAPGSRQATKGRIPTVSALLRLGPPSSGLQGAAEMFSLRRHQSPSGRLRADRAVVFHLRLLRPRCALPDLPSSHPADRPGQQHPTSHQVNPLAAGDTRTFLQQRGVPSGVAGAPADRPTCSTAAAATTAASAVPAATSAAAEGPTTSEEEARRSAASDAEEQRGDRVRPRRRKERARGPATSTGPRRRRSDQRPTSEPPPQGSPGQAPGEDQADGGARPGETLFAAATSSADRGGSFTGCVWLERPRCPDH